MIAWLRVSQAKGYPLSHLFNGKTSHGMWVMPTLELLLLFIRQTFLRLEDPTHPCWFKIQNYCRLGIHPVVCTIPDFLGLRVTMWFIHKKKDNLALTLVHRNPQVSDTQVQYYCKISTVGSVCVMIGVWLSYCDTVSWGMVQTKPHRCGQYGPCSAILVSLCQQCTHSQGGKFWKLLAFLWYAIFKCWLVSPHLWLFIGSYVSIARSFVWPPPSTYGHQIVFTQWEETGKNATFTPSTLELK